MDKPLGKLVELFQQCHGNEGVFFLSNVVNEEAHSLRPEKWYQR